VIYYVCNSKKPEALSRNFYKEENDALRKSPGLQGKSNFKGEPK
jgi:hypothetical protein